MDDSNALNELKKISKILLLANAPLVEKELGKVASTDDRKKMWVLMDGNRMQKDIADAIGVTQAAVSYFLTAARAAEFIDYKQGQAPRRLLDYVPPAWIELFPGERQEKGKKAESKTAAVTLDTLDQSAETRRTEETEQHG